MAVLVGVPMLEGNIFGGHLDETGAGFGETPSQETAQTKLPGVVLVVAGLGFKRQIECLGRRRAEQTVRVIERAQEGFFLVTAANLADRALREQFAVESFGALESGRAHARRRGEALSRAPGVCAGERAQI